MLGHLGIVNNLLLQMMTNLMLVYFVLLYLQEGLQAENESCFLEDFLRFWHRQSHPGTQSGLCNTGLGRRVSPISTLQMTGSRGTEVT